MGAMSIVGVAPHNKTTERACTRVCALLLCAGGAEEDPVAEVLEITEAKADALEDLGLVVAALGEAVGVGIADQVCFFACWQHVKGDMPLGIRNDGLKALAAGIALELVSRKLGSAYAYSGR